jgi:hypothetical protein
VNNIIVCEILVPKIQKKDKIPLNHWIKVPTPIYGLDKKSL